VAVVFEIRQGFLNDLSVGCPKLFPSQIILELNNDRVCCLGLVLQIMAAAGKPCLLFSEAASAFGDAARLYDLTVVLQPDAALQCSDNMTATEILLQAGGPVLFVPHIFHGSFKPKRIGICWDGSRLAARAVRDARQFLSNADAVVTISINEAQLVPAEASAQKLVQHMGRSGLATKLIELTADHSEIQPSILSLAADETLDMLVMGAYGHARLQERLLGGVTREMLQTMTVPTLMSH
jgi:nucleotide-binding universal stress UspA family protein